MDLYGIIAFIIVVSFGLGFGLYLVAYLISPKYISFEKSSAYECGFDPFGTAYQPFDVRYYLVSILFIVFDLEVALLFPWSVTFMYIGYAGYFSAVFFLGILTIGFAYEWISGALDWD